VGFFTRAETRVSDGGFHGGSLETSGFMNFEPTISTPAYGEDEEAWRWVVRPTPPLFIEQPIPEDTLRPLVRHAEGAAPPQNGGLGR